MCRSVCMLVNMRGCVCICLHVHVFVHQCMSVNSCAHKFLQAKNCYMCTCLSTNKFKCLYMCVCVPAQEILTFWLGQCFAYIFIDLYSFLNLIAFLYKGLLCVLISHFYHFLNPAIIL